MSEILLPDEETFYTKVEVVACGEFIVSRSLLSRKSMEKMSGVCERDVEDAHTGHSILGRGHLRYFASIPLPLVPHTRPSTFLLFFLRGFLGG